MKNIFDNMLDDYELDEDEAAKVATPAEAEQKVTVLKAEPEKVTIPVKPTIETDAKLFVVRTTANREDQVFDFLQSNIERKGMNIYSIVRAHGMRGYIFIETPDINEAQRAVMNVPYARGILGSPVGFNEIEHMLETTKHEINIQKNDVVEIISGPFKREKAKITRIDKQKEEAVVELLEAAVSIPITLKFDAIKVIRRDENGDERSENV